MPNGHDQSEREPRRAPTSDQIRHRTDVAGSGDKVPFPDPASAPLGTDDEAAGRPPSAHERSLAGRQDKATGATLAAARRKPDHWGESWSGPLMVGAVLLCGAAILASYLLGR
jgi:hypothetical protein